VQHSTDWESGKRQNPRFDNRSGSGNPDRRVNRPDVLRNEGGSSRRPEQTEEHIMMVGSWPCKVSSEIHINGRRVSELVHDDKGKTIALEPEERKDLKRARVVLSKGREVVGLGYSRVTSVAAKVTDKRENSGNHGRVNRVSKTEQHYPSRVNQVCQNSNMDWQADRVSPNSSMYRQTDQVSRLATRSIKKEFPVMLLTWKPELQRIRPTRKVGLRKIQLTWKTGLYRTLGARNWKKEKVLLQAKGQLHGGAQGVLPHKNADCKRCVKESWPRKKKRKSGTIGLTVYDPRPSRSKRGGKNG
jgi:hypothetical protein